MLRRTFLSQFLLALNKGGIEKAHQLLQKASDSGFITAATMAAKQDNTIIRHAYGAKPSYDTVFLLASITKPMTAAGLMVLAGRGELRLSDRVRRYIPEFRGGDRDLVTIKHLLTHTSGLPDMLPENEELRKRHAPLKDFVAGAAKTPLLFKPGTKCEYQSMGILLAAEIAERVTKQPFRRFLRDQVFDRLGMLDTSLGLGGRAIADTAQCQVTGNDDWNWNSAYWRDLGAPWGGAHSTVSDVLRFLEYFLNPNDGVLAPESARSMIANQNQGLNTPWGIGFAVRPGGFGRHCSPRTFGHSGSTGTLCWADPASKTSFVVLTTRPAAESSKALLAPVSDAISEATV